MLNYSDFVFGKFIMMLTLSVSAVFEPLNTKFKVVRSKEEQLDIQKVRTCT